MWDDPGFRIEAKVNGVLVLHFFETRSQVSFLCHSTHSWEMVHFLEGFELSELLLKDRDIVPDDIHVSMPCDFVSPCLFSS